MRVYDGQNHIDWSKAREDLLRELWPQRFISLSEICSRLAVREEGAVTQKARRMGLGPRHKGQGRWASSLEPNLPRRRTANRMSKTLKAKVEQRALPTGEKLTNNTAADFAIPLEQRRGLLELNGTTCRWPVGTVGDPDFFFCGGEPVKGLPYCAYHKHCAYRPWVAK